MAFEQAVSIPIVGEKVVYPQLIKRENFLTQQLYTEVQRNRNTALSPNERTYAWESALRTASSKYSIGLNVKQHLRPAYFKEPTIDKAYVVDDRVLEGYSKELKGLVDRGETNMIAAFALVEYFLRTKHHNLTPEQVIAVARSFPPPAPHTSFAEYKRMTEEAHQQTIFPYKTPEESWVMKREIMDLLEVTENIRTRWLAPTRGKTIFISDLMRASAEALRTVHTASSRLGAATIMARDKIILTGKETPKYRNIGREMIIRMLTNPSLIVGMLASGRASDLRRDIDKVAKFPEGIQIVGQEHIPANGPAIIAFSHMNNWRDKSIPPFWELTKMLQTVLDKRQQPQITLVAYLSYFKEIAPTRIRPQVVKFVDGVIEKARQRYNVNVIDIAFSPQKSQNFIEEATATLKRGELIFISPEGAPANELIKAKRGVGMLARLSKAPVVGVAFHEDRLANGTFVHKVVFTPPQVYPEATRGKDRDQSFIDGVMRDMAQALPPNQRGIYG